MYGAGPWRAHGSPSLGVGLRETTNPLLSQGAFGDIQLALDNVEWRREVNLSWLQFSRWGIQQIILISRLYYLKNPIIRRLVDIAAMYVFARGVEISVDDEQAQTVLDEFLERNRQTLGQVALTDLERRKHTDGNLFFALFADRNDSGKVSIREIDAIEIQEIICNPDDTSEPWFYRRSWTQQQFDSKSGSVSQATIQAWYPALNYDPVAKPATLNGAPVRWDCRVYHRKCGATAKWTFGCPIIYPAINWAKAAKEYLESCATLARALAQFAFTVTTKGGQQALAGLKQQLETNVGPGSSAWDTNPPPNTASTFASGPGTELKAFSTAGAGADPEKSRQYKLMCCMVVGVPETFLGDVSTGNLATATTLDRPTETAFLEKQEAWREDLMVIAKYVLSVSLGAANGRLREAGKGNTTRIVEAKRKRVENGGRSVYVEAPKRKDEIRIKVNFPAIREGDVPQLVNAIVAAMTLGNKDGNVIGIDEKTGIGALYDVLPNVENGQETLEEQYPEGSYDPDRTQEEPPPEPAKPPAVPPPNPAAIPPPTAPPVRESLRRAAQIFLDAARENGHAANLR